MRFFGDSITPFRAAGVTPLLIDHQSKPQPGQSYQGKRAFGSVFKWNLCRSVIQAEPSDGDEGVRFVRLRHVKHNFGPLADPFAVKLTFTEERIAVEAAEMDAATLAEERTLNATDRVRLALEEGPLYPVDIAEVTRLSLNTVKNVLTKLRKQGIVETTGERNGDGAEEVRLVSSRPYLYRDEDRDTDEAFTNEGAA